MNTGFHHNTHRPARQRGFTLVEIMVALVISLLLIAGTIQIFINSKQAYRMTDALSRIQENGRFAIQIMARDLRMADYWGCAKPDAVNNNLNSSTSFDLSAGGLAGTDGPDTITVRGASGTELAVPTAMSGLAGDVTVPTTNNLKQGDIALVGDCISADIFQITNIGTGTLEHQAAGSPGNATANLSRQYETDATVSKAREVTYTLGTGTSGEPALFRSENGTNNELVDGIADMQITYGEDTSGNGVANYYVPAGSVSNMADVVSVRVDLCVRSAEDNITPEPQTYYCNGAKTTATDKRLRHGFSTTISLRNRIQ